MLYLRKENHILGGAKVNYRMNSSNTELIQAGELDFDTAHKAVLYQIESNTEIRIKKKSKLSILSLRHFFLGRTKVNVGKNSSNKAPIDNHRFDLDTSIMDCQTSTKKYSLMNHSKIVGTEFVMNHSKIVEKRSIEVGVIFGSNSSDPALNDTSEFEFDTTPFYTYCQ